MGRRKTEKKRVGEKKEIFLKKGVDK